MMTVSRMAVATRIVVSSIVIDFAGAVAVTG